MCSMRWGRRPSRCARRWPRGRPRAAPVASPSCISSHLQGVAGRPYSDAVHKTKWGFTHPEWARLGGFGAAILALHLAGWSLLFLYAGRYPFLVGLGVIAYTFGLRHAFDADHIAAIDNTTRKFLQQGKRALGTGFFFSLGHSTVVFGL